MLGFAAQSIGQLADVNRLMLPTAVVLVILLWFRMRPIYRLMRIGTEANAAYCSAAFNVWWAESGAPESLVLDDRRR